MQRASGPATGEPSRAEPWRDGFGASLVGVGDTRPRLRVSRRKVITASRIDFLRSHDCYESNSVATFTYRQFSLLGLYLALHHGSCLFVCADDHRRRTQDTHIHTTRHARGTRGVHRAGPHQLIVMYATLQPCTMRLE